jgi:hypothetical protein
MEKSCYMKFKILSYLAIIILTSILSTQAEAKESKFGKFYAVGFGRMSCKEFISFEKQYGKEKASYMIGSWVHGFISGVNAGRTRKFRKPVSVGENDGPDKIWIMTREYCHKYSDSNLGTAAQSVYMIMESPRLNENPKSN